MSYKDKHALETLPGEIARLDNDIKKLQSKLADPDLYTRDRTAFETTSAALSKCQSDLDTAETLWLEIEERRAALGTGD